MPGSDESDRTGRDARRRRGLERHHPELESFPSLKVGMALGAESGFGFALPDNSPSPAR